MIGGKVVEKALLDLGASVNLLPYIVYKQLGLGEDFIVLDTDPLVKEANLVPIILGRPFLATSNAIIKLQEWAYQITRKKKKVQRSYVLLILCHQENCLMEVLKRCKKAIGWQISDLKGISPLVCTHHIYMEEEAKPIHQFQRRLNPHLQEVVRKSFGAKLERNGAKTGQKQGLRNSQPLRNRHFAAKPVHSLRPLSKIFAAAKPLLTHECHLMTPISQCEMVKSNKKKKNFASKLHFAENLAATKPLLAHDCEMVKSQNVKNPNFTAAPPFRKFQESIASNGARFGFETEKLWPFEDDCANHEWKCCTSILLLRDAIWKGVSQLRNHFWHTSAILQHSSPHFEAAIHLRNHF
ncbi:hypothetical protein AAG906_020908 [Vitis piasezkii]